MTEDDREHGLSGSSPIHLLISSLSSRAPSTSSSSCLSFFDWTSGLLKRRSSSLSSLHLLHFLALSPFASQWLGCNEVTGNNFAVEHAKLHRQVEERMRAVGRRQHLQWHGSVHVTVTCSPLRQRTVLGSGSDLGACRADSSQCVGFLLRRPWRPSHLS
jgi:hypothetical protein